MVYRYLFKYPTDPYILTDGRNVRYLAQETHINREKLAKVLKRKQLCCYAEICNLVNRCKPNYNPLMFFDELSESEVKLWRKK